MTEANLGDLRSKGRLSGNSQHQWEEVAQKLGEAQETRRTWVNLGRTHCHYSWSCHLHLLNSWLLGCILISPLPLSITHTRISALCKSTWLADRGPCAHAHGYLTPCTGGRAFPPTYLPNRKSIWILGHPKEKISTVYPWSLLLRLTSVRTLRKWQAALTPCLTR